MNRSGVLRVLEVDALLLARHATPSVAIRLRRREPVEHGIEGVVLVEQEEGAREEHHGDEGVGHFSREKKLAALDFAGQVDF